MKNEPEIRTTADGQLVVTWGDGHVSTYSLAGMRRECRCPVCRPGFGAAVEVKAVRLVRWGLLVSMYVLPLAVVFMLPSVDTVVVSGPAVVLLGIYLWVTGWRARYEWVRTIGASHVGMVAFLTVLVNANRWSPGEAYVPFLLLCTPYVLGAVWGTWYVYQRPPPTKEAPSWHCRGCGYLLVGLAEDRCPECGKEFDRADLPAGAPRG